MPMNRLSRTVVTRPHAYYAVPQKLDNGLRSTMYEKRTTKSISTDAESEGGI